MSSGFVSAGTDQEPIERDDEWVRVQKELEEERRRKAELGKQDGGKSLYDVLQQNKMAKQEAFEEKIKLKNQFRALDEDEIEFLDSIMESTRAHEATVKKETAEQLEQFRRQREEAEKAYLNDTSTEIPSAANEAEDWKIASRKRRREKSGATLIPGRKRKSLGDVSTDPPTKEAEPNKRPKELVEEGKSVTTPATEEKPKASDVDKNPTQQLAKPAADPPAPSLGLAGYSSDSE